MRPSIGQQLIIICNMCKGHKTTFLRTRFIYKHVINLYYKPVSVLTHPHRTAASPRHRFRKSATRSANDSENQQKFQSSCIISFRMSSVTPANHRRRPRKICIPFEKNIGETRQCDRETNCLIGLHI